MLFGFWLLQTLVSKSTFHRKSLFFFLFFCKEYCDTCEPQDMCDSQNRFSSIRMKLESTTLYPTCIFYSHYTLWFYFYSQFPSCGYSRFLHHRDFSFSIFSFVCSCCVLKYQYLCIYFCISLIAKLKRKRFQNNCRKVFIVFRAAGAHNQRRCGSNSTGNNNLNAAMLSYNTTFESDYESTVIYFERYGCFNFLILFQLLLL